MVSYFDIPRFSWFPRWLEKARESKTRKDTMRHELYLGKGGSGKTFLNKFLNCYETENGTAKIVQVNIKKKEALREFLAYAEGNDYPSGREGRKFDLAAKASQLPKYRSLMPEFKEPIPLHWQHLIAENKIKVKVYVPLTRNCPNKLPANFIPFTVPIQHLTEKEIGESIIQVLYAGKEYSTGYQAIQDALTKTTEDASLPDLWFQLKKLKDSSYFAEQKSFVGYGGIKFPNIGDSASPQTLASAIIRLKPFAEIGLFSSKNFPYALPNLLRNELKDQKTIVGVYTGFLKDPLQQLFCEIYFTQCCSYLMSEEGLGKDLNYAIKVYWEDAADEFKSTKTKLFKESDVASSTFFIKMLTRIRHAGIVIAASVQSPKLFEDTQLTNFAWHFFTGNDTDAEIQWIAEQMKVSAGEIGDIFNKWQWMQIGKPPHLRVYRFALKQLGIPSWREGKRIEYGFELPHACASNPQKIRDFRDWTELARNTGEPTTNTFTTARRLLIQEYAARAKPIAFQLKKMEEARKKYESQNNRQRADLIQRAAIIANKSKSIAQVQKRLNVHRETAKNLIREAINLGLLNPKSESYFRDETRVMQQETLNEENGE